MSSNLKLYTAEPAIKCTDLVDEQGVVIILDDELPPGALRKSPSVLGPVHFRSGVAHDLAVEGGGFPDPGGDVTHLDAELRGRFLLLVFIF